MAWCIHQWLGVSINGSLIHLALQVHATKPQASRNESAEIFVVCQYYFAPAKLDGRFLDPRYVFKELDMEPANKINLLHPDKQKKLKAEGYSELRGVFHTVPAADFITAEDPLSVLQVISAVSRIYVDWLSTYRGGRLIVELSVFCFSFL